MLSLISSLSHLLPLSAKLSQLSPTVKEIFQTVSLRHLITTQSFFSTQRQELSNQRFTHPLLQQTFKRLSIQWLLNGSSFFYKQELSVSIKLKVARLPHSKNYSSQNSSRTTKTRVYPKLSLHSLCVRCAHLELIVRYSVRPLSTTLKPHNLKRSKWLKANMKNWQALLARNKMIQSQTKVLVRIVTVLHLIRKLKTS